MRCPDLTQTQTHFEMPSFAYEKAVEGDGAKKKHRKTEAQLRMNPHAQRPPRYLDKSCHVCQGEVASGTGWFVC